MKRKGTEYLIGSSLYWYRGKNNWLYLGNAYDDTVAKIKLAIIPNDNVLLSMKGSKGILYWMTDTHWNNKGAFIPYSGFSKLFNFPVPKVDFKHGLTHSGDLIGIAKLKKFPLNAEDNWDVIWKEEPAWIEKEILNEQKSTFGSASIVTNNKALSNKYIWVIGDSFTGALRQYFNATFKEIHYMGHWGNKLNDLPTAISNADRKPDLIVIVRVERSF